jgi:SpoVK/Ycf46/Vps4 family AAA+-type ATPase
MEDGMEPAVKAVLEERVRTQDDFGNARGVRNLFEAVVKNQQTRIAGLDDWGENEELTLRKEDLGGELVEVEHPKTVDELLEELNSMIGLAAVKNEIGKFVAMVQMNKKREAAGFKAAKIEDLHMVFSGNPGTGKTTVARLLGSIMKGLGILPKGHLVECSRSDLVAGYVGQTAEKTEKVVMSAMGGVLFIDEAYTLTKKDGGNDFGQEAVDQLLKMLEDYRGKFMCIVAGYTNEMAGFIASNPGLERRFPKKITFEDYSPDELCEIFKAMVKGKGLKLGEGVMDEARELIAVRSKKANFGNAGGIRNIVNRLFENMNKRLLTQEIGDDPDTLVTITVEDVRKEL